MTPHPDDLVIDDPVTDAERSTLHDVFATAAARASDRRVLVMAKLHKEDGPRQDVPWRPVVWPMEYEPDAEEK